jgi:multidrug efflux pump subunit AcrA (membrane-fusion protein)
MRAMRAFIPTLIPTAGVVFTIVVTAAPSSGRGETSSQPAPQVVAVRATTACFSASIRVTGFLVARDEAVVTLDVPGTTVVEVLAKEGDRVTSGQTLARVNRPSGPGPDGAAAKSTTLKAPATGVITRSTAMVGATSSPMSPEPLFRIAVDNAIELEADVPSIHVPALATGQTARAEIAPGRELSGQVRLVPAAIDQRTQLGRARISLERDPLLRLGMFARATIDANRSCGVSVPSSAVRYRTQGASVQVIREDAIETRMVQVGLRSDTNTEIVSGLKEGELIVASAGNSLRDGDKVSPITADTTRMGQR